MEEEDIKQATYDWRMVARHVLSSGVHLLFFWQENHGVRHSLYSVKSTWPATRTDLVSCQADVRGRESGGRGRRLVSEWLPCTELHSPFSRHTRAHEDGNSRAALVHQN